MLKEGCREVMSSLFLALLHHRSERVSADDDDEEEDARGANPERSGKNSETQRERKAKPR